MKKYLLLALFSMILTGCGMSKYHIKSDQQFNNLSSLLKKLDKSKNNTPELREQIETLYLSLSKQLLTDIDIYSTLTGTDKWDKIISSYQTLNRLSDVIHKSKAREFIAAESYQSALQVAKQNAAADYYQLALDKMQYGDKASFREAYYLFTKVNQYYPGFRDVKKQMDYAWKQSILNVVINPVTDQSSFYAQMTPNRFGNSFNSDLLQRSLVRDLGGDFNKNAPARFYMDREAYLARIDVDWLVDIMWTRLDVPYPLTRTSTIERSKQIEISKDSLSKPVYQTVTAKLKITQRYFTAYGELECRITDAKTRDNIFLRRYNSQTEWSQSYATYTGDRRALTDEDWTMINNNTPLPDRQDILLVLYQKIYPQLKNGIYNEVKDF